LFSTTQQKTDRLQLQTINFAEPARS